MTKKAASSWEKISIADAKSLSSKFHVLIWWRPEPQLPEHQQYAMVHKLTKPRSFRAAAGGN